MTPLRYISILVGRMKRRVIERILAYRLQARHPTLRNHPTAIWDYGLNDWDAIELGRDVVVLAYAEIIVYKHADHSTVEGRLVLEDRVVIATGANIRAAGGTIRIGRDSGIGQHTVLVAANHTIEPGTLFKNTPYDETRTGVVIGTNVWVAANCVILPGVTIGDNAVIAAGSVVNRSVPPNELWGGVPAQRIKLLSGELTEIR